MIFRLYPGSVPSGVYPIFNVLYTRKRTIPGLYILLPYLSHFQCLTYVKWDQYGSIYILPDQSHFQYLRYVKWDQLGSRYQVDYSEIYSRIRPIFNAFCMENGIDPGVDI